MCKFLRRVRCHVLRRILLKLLLSSPLVMSQRKFVVHWEQLIQLNLKWSIIWCFYSKSKFTTIILWVIIITRTLLTRLRITIGSISCCQWCFDWCTSSIWLLRCCWCYSRDCWSSTRNNSWSWIDIRICVDIWCRANRWIHFSNTSIWCD